MATRTTKKTKAKPAAPKKQLVVERKELPTAALWAGTVIAVILCTTSILELVLTIGDMTVPGVIWSVFVICFTAFYSVDFGKQLRARRTVESGNN